MLSITLADIIDTQDPCTPGGPNYNPNDPICALTASVVAQDTGSTETVGPATTPGAASLAGFGWKTALFLGALGALGTGAYFLHKHYIKA